MKFNYGDLIEYTSDDELGVLPMTGGNKFVEGVGVPKGSEGVYVDTLPESAGKGWHFTRVEIDGQQYACPVHESMFRAKKEN